MRFLLLLLLAAPAFAGDNYIVEDLEKEGQVQAFKINADKKFSVTGGTVTGRMFVSTLTVSGSPVATLGASQTFTGQNIFNAVTISTGALLDIGFVTSPKTCAATTECDVACPAGLRAVSCDGLSDDVVGVMWRLFKDTLTSCRMDTAAAANLTIIANCARFK